LYSLILSTLLVLYENNIITNKQILKWLPYIIFLLSILSFSASTSFFEYLNSLRKSTFIVENYTTPKVISVPHRKKNLILIYVESLENTYSEKEAFNKDLLKALNSKTEHSLSFQDYKETFGTSWTVASIVSTQCGIPLRLLNINKDLKLFMPSITCLGDILKNSGYKNIFMGGAHLAFAGKGLFLTQHGYDEVYGRDEWKKRGETGFHEWGLHDDILLKNARNKVDQLEKEGVPYNLTILTIDMHSTSGYLSPECYQRGALDFADIVECTSNMLADFLDHIDKNGYLKNTNVVILGDHLSMTNNEVAMQLLSKPNRTIYNKFITIEELKKNRETIHHFSIFPSILYSLGFRFDKNRLGLGASGFGELDPNFIIDFLDRDDLYKKLSYFSTKYLEFWKINK
jgi:phosphoglycerol transferase